MPERRSSGARISVSSRYVPRVPAFTPSTWRDAPQGLVHPRASQGASELSFARTTQVMKVVATLALTATFSRAATGQTSPEHRPGPADQHAAVANGPVGSPASLQEGDLARLVAEVDAESVEDGITHPAEAALESFVRQHGTGGILAMLFAKNANLSRTASLLRLLGRLANVPPEARLRLVESGLSSASVEVRDAAAQAVESWRDTSLVAMLERHRESVAWLADYMARVARDLEA